MRHQKEPRAAPARRGIPPACAASRAGPKNERRAPRALHRPHASPRAALARPRAQAAYPRLARALFQPRRHDPRCLPVLPRPNLSEELSFQKGGRGKQILKMHRLPERVLKAET